MSDYRTAYVYAGGSMSGLTLADSRNGWRADFARLLKKRKGAEHIHILSPNRSEPRTFKGVFATDGAGTLAGIEANKKDRYRAGRTYRKEAE